MNPSTIYHRPQSEFAFAADDTHYVFRLRTGRGEAEKCTFFYADRACMEPELTFTAAPMVRLRRDQYFDWYEIRLETVWERIAYYFLLEKGEETLTYFGDCYELAGTPTRSDYFQLPFNHRSDRLTVPQWTEDCIVYNIFPDSFAAGKGQQVPGGDHSLGGTLRGITENLDYIQELGCSCIYLNPIFKAKSYHRYDTLDYYAIDPSMGTEEDLHALVEGAHERGMRVILDGVFNHIGADHPFFADVLGKGKDSPYYPCFYSLPEKPRYPEGNALPEYTCFSYVANMPKTDTSHPFLEQYFCDVGVYWIEHFHADGWRLDVANELDDGFLRAFRKAVKRAKPDAIIVGEVWENAGHYLQGDMLDSAMNYDFRRYCRRFFAEGTVDAQTFDANVSTLLLRYKETANPAQLNLLDSHDVSRFLSLCGGNWQRMELAVLFQMSFPGMPCVFYGNEKGLTGISEPEYRQAMPWNASHPLEEVYRKLIALRKEKEALRRGSFETVRAEDKVYCYRRCLGRQAVTVTMNLGESPIPAEEKGSLLLKKGSHRGIIGPWEYEVREEIDYGGDHL